MWEVTGSNISIMYKYINMDGINRKMTEEKQNSASSTFGSSENHIIEENLV